MVVRKQECNGDLWRALRALINRILPTEGPEFTSLPAAGLERKRRNAIDSTGWSVNPARPLSICRQEIFPSSLANLINSETKSMPKTMQAWWLNDGVQNIEQKGQISKVYNMQSTYRVNFFMKIPCWIPPSRKKNAIKKNIQNLNADFQFPLPLPLQVALICDQTPPTQLHIILPSNLWGRFVRQIH